MLAVEPYEIGVVRQLAFSSIRQRMSVVVSFLPSAGLESGEPAQFVLYSKGSPEMIASLCLPETGESYSIFCSISSLPLAI